MYGSLFILGANFTANLSHIVLSPACLLLCSWEREAEAFVWCVWCEKKATRGEKIASKLIEFNNYAFEANRTGAPSCPHGQAKLMVQYCELTSGKKCHQQTDTTGKMTWRHWLRTTTMFDNVRNVERQPTDEHGLDVGWFIFFCFARCMNTAGPGTGETDLLLCCRASFLRWGTRAGTPMLSFSSPAGEAQLCDM